MGSPTQASLGDWADFGLQADVRPALSRVLAAGRSCALVTLYAAEGPTPHGVGAQMLVGSDHMAGYLSGGCIEADVALHARECLRDGRPRRLVYGRGGPPDIRLLCGARIELLIEHVSPEDPAAHRLMTLTAARQPALWLSDGAARACLGEGDGPSGLPASLRAAYEEALGAPHASAAAGAAVFRRHDPAPQMVVVGHDPTALALAALATSMGWGAVVVRPRGPEAPPPLPGVRYLRGAPEAAFAELPIDAWTAIAATAHDLDADGAALAAALPSSAAYVGVLGSRKRIPERIDGLRAAGVPEAAIARLRAPIGLPIGAQTPWEIAIAILAEVVEELKTRRATRRWPAPADEPA